MIKITGRPRPARREQQRRSYELLAHYVMPRYTGALAGVQAAHALGVVHRMEAQQAMKQAIERASKARAHPPSNGPLLEPRTLLNRPS